ncbi:hypothetical protein OHB36_24970 [Streptomyces sp. NBC_00320]|uniref:hypothetical protein n=1 Tax=unclassified Streptomyces TaxID=2593676 RepID=UPI002259CCBB|nr:hypothetical protein [Streptomyces sp. NBC_00320]MCX5149986.1 hypothetical protein [Streptomyces sp. NBC_00320]
MTIRVPCSGTYLGTVAARALVVWSGHDRRDSGGTPRFGAVDDFVLSRMRSLTRQYAGAIVRDAGVPAMVKVIDGLVAAGEHETVLRHVGPEEDV